MEWNALLLATAVASGFGPFATARAPVTSDVRGPRAPARVERGHVAHVAWRAYRATVGSFQGPRCPHAPSCSMYAAEAVERHGLVAGGVIAAQRLYRGSRSSSARPLRRDGSGRYVDPLDDATSWMEEPRP
jgi:putative component of membrane protein insertase Oxa1/YidC/SpoIIIJ protein YidD